MNSDGTSQLDVAADRIDGAARRPLRGATAAAAFALLSDDLTGPGLPVVGRRPDWVVVAQRFTVWVRLDDPSLVEHAPGSVPVAAAASLHAAIEARVLLQHEIKHVATAAT